MALSCTLSVATIKANRSDPTSLLVTIYRNRSCVFLAHLHRMRCCAQSLGNIRCGRHADEQLRLQPADIIAVNVVSLRWIKILPSI